MLIFNELLHSACHEAIIKRGYQLFDINGCMNDYCNGCQIYGALMNGDLYCVDVVPCDV